MATPCRFDPGPGHHISFLHVTPLEGSIVTHMSVHNLDFLSIVPLIFSATKALPR